MKCEYCGDDFEMLSYTHSGKDLNNATITIDKTEAAIFPAGSGPSGTPTQRVVGVHPTQVELLVFPGLPGRYSAFLRAHSQAGWSSYTPAIAFVWPPSEPQPAQVAPKLTNPSRPVEGKAEAKP